jgi:hypothetical protein
MKICGWIFIIRGVEDTRHKQLSDLPSLQLLALEPITSATKVRLDTRKNYTFKRKSPFPASHEIVYELNGSGTRFQQDEKSCNFFHFF